jgi:arginase
MLHTHWLHCTWLAGDLLEPTDAEAHAAVTKVLESDRRIIVLGGDHAVTRMVIPAVKAHHALQRPLICVQFDAHPDLYDSLPCVSGADPTTSHAAQFTRMLESSPPSIDLLLQVGIRTATTSQLENARLHGVQMLHAIDTPLDGRDIAQWVNEQASARFGTSVARESAVYISVDLDGLDPAFAPGVAHPEPGGLSSRQLLTAIERLGGDVVAADVVELLPSVDTPNGLTARVGAAAVKALAARMMMTC